MLKIAKTDTGATFRVRVQPGASKNEIMKTVETGERFPAKFGRSGSRPNFTFDRVRKGKPRQRPPQRQEERNQHLFRLHPLA